MKTTEQLAKHVEQVYFGGPIVLEEEEEDPGRRALKKRVDRVILQQENEARESHYNNIYERIEGSED